MIPVLSVIALTRPLHQPNICIQRKIQRFYVIRKLLEYVSCSFGINFTVDNAIVDFQSLIFVVVILITINIFVRSMKYTFKHM